MRAKRYWILDAGYWMKTIRHRVSSIQNPGSSGFTLIEVLVAVVVLVAAFAIVWQSFVAVMNAWERGGKMLDELRHGDFVMEQLVQALRSTAYFRSAPDKYGFRLKSGARSYPADKISWVTSGTAFIPPDSPLASGLHRIEFTIGNNGEGESGVEIKAYPYVADEDTVDAVEPWFVSSEVKGVQCRTYNAEEEEWQNEWEDTNSIPTLVEVTLYMDPVEEYGEAVKIQRLVEIPIAPAFTNAVKYTAGGEKTAEGTQEQPAQGTTEGQNQQSNQTMPEAQ